MSVKEKILNAIYCQKLSLANEGERKWYNYKTRVTKLFWGRNLYDGYQIEVYNKITGIHLETIYC